MTAIGLLAGKSGNVRLQSVEHLYAGYPAIADNIYRLSQATRDGRPWQEELRLMADSSAPGALRATAWIKISVAPIETDGGRGGSLWRVQDVSGERIEQETAFQQLQHIIDYLDHSPAGFLLCRRRRATFSTSTPRWPTGWGSI